MTAGLRARWMMVFLVVSLAGVLLWSGCDKESSDIPTEYSTFNSLVDEGWEAYQEGNFSLAIEKFNEALGRTADPTEGRNAYRGLGWTYSRVGQHEKAVANFQFVISAEVVRTGKTPIVREENVHFTAVADSSFELQQVVRALIVKVHDVSNPGVWVEDEPIDDFDDEDEVGSESFNLKNDGISNKAGDDLGDPLDNSLSWDTSATGLTRPVIHPDSLLSVGDYYVDCQKGQVTIKPWWVPIDEFDVDYRYEEDTYIVRYAGYHDILLSEELDATDDQGFPLDALPLREGDVLLVDLERYNPPGVSGGGGTYFQADAYAGIAASYAARNDDASAIAAARAAIYIDKDLGSGPQDYYHRQLFEGDNISLWHIYELLAISYYNNQNFMELEKLLRDFLEMDDIPTPDDPGYETKLFNSIHRFIERGSSEWSRPEIP